MTLIASAVRGDRPDIADGWHNIPQCDAITATRLHNAAVNNNLAAATSIGSVLGVAHHYPLGE
jgi:hypothetical protein